MSRSLPLANERLGAMLEAHTRVVTECNKVVELLVDPIMMPGTNGTVPNAPINHQQVQLHLHQARAALEQFAKAATCEEVQRGA